MKELIDFVCDGIKYNPKGKFYNTKSPVQTHPLYATNYYHKITSSYISSTGLSKNNSNAKFDLYVNGVICDRCLNVQQLINTILDIAENKDGIILRSYNDYYDVYLYYIK